MRLSRTRSIALATAAAVTAAGVVAPSALAQEETALDAETAAVSESAAPENESESESESAESAESESAESESESETPAPDETDPEDEPAGETTAPAKIDLTVEADSDKSTVTRVLEEEDEVKKALENHPSVGWSIKDGSLPVGMKFSTVSSTLTIQPGQLRDDTPRTFVATDLATGEVVAEVEVTVTGISDAPVNPGNDIKKTTPRQVAIIVGVAAAIAATLAGMVQFLVPGGWQHVISYFSGQR